MNYNTLIIALLQNALYVNLVFCVYSGVKFVQLTINQQRHEQVVAKTIIKTGSSKTFAEYGHQNRSFLNVNCLFRNREKIKN